MCLHRRGLKNELLTPCVIPAGPHQPDWSQETLRMKNYSQTVTPNFDDVVQDTSVGSGGDGGWTMVTDSVGRGAPMINQQSETSSVLYHSDV